MLTFDSHVTFKKTELEQEILLKIHLMRLCLRKSMAPFLKQFADTMMADESSIFPQNKNWNELCFSNTINLYDKADKLVL